MIRHWQRQKSPARTIGPDIRCRIWCWPALNFIEEYRSETRNNRSQFTDVNISQFIDHVDHAVKIAGIDHVGLSGDFDGGGGVKGWDNASQTFNVTRELLRRGYTESDLAKLWSGNILRVMRAVESAAAR